MFVYVYKINTVVCIIYQWSVGVSRSATLQKQTQQNLLFSLTTVMTDSEHQWYFDRLLTEIALAAIYTFFLSKPLPCYSPANPQLYECTLDCGLQEDCEEEQSAPRYAIEKFGPNNIYSGQTESHLSVWSIHNTKIYRMVPVKTTKGIISGAE